MTLAPTLLLATCLGIPALLTLYVSLRLVWLIAHDKPEFEVPEPAPYGRFVESGMCPKCLHHGARRTRAYPNPPLCPACWVEAEGVLA